MPRQGRGSGGSSRPAAAPSRPTVPARAPAPQQSRSATTAAYPSAAQRAPVAATPQAPAVQQSAGPGLFGQMASTAAGVAVGSSIGHAIGGFFGGGSSQAVAAPVDSPVAQTENGAAYNTQYQGPRACENDIGNFRRCMDENQGSLSICGWYLDQLKACQAAAGQY